MRRGLSSVRKPGSKLTLYFGRDPGCADFPSRAVDAEILGVRCRVAAVADSFCCGLPVIRSGIFPRALLAECDMLRIAELFPEYAEKLPEYLQRRL